MFIIDITRDLGYTVILDFEKDSSVEIVKSYLFTNKRNSKIELSDDEFIETRPGKVKKLFENIFIYEDNDYKTIFVINDKKEIIFEFNMDYPKLINCLKELRDKGIIDVDVEDIFNQLEYT